jgi:hypothetical protein
MKASRIVLWSGAAFLALLILFALILMKVSISRDIGAPPETARSLSGKSVEISVDTSGLTALYLKGGWEAGLERADTGVGKITIPVEAEEYLDIERRGSELHISLKKGFARRHDSSFAVDLDLSSLTMLGVEGACDLEMSGFREQRMEILIGGSANITAREVRAEYLFVKAGGAANLDLAGALFVNVELDMEGAANADLQMDGGTLSGRIAGIGSVTYGGTVREEKIRSEGIASVKRR